MTFFSMKNLLLILALSLVAASAQAQRSPPPPGLTLHVAALPLGNDANPGTSVLPMATICAAINRAYYAYDWQGASPTITIDDGSIQNGQCNVGGQIVGNNVMQLIGNHAVWMSDTDCLSIGDNAEMVVYSFTWVCNRGNHPGMAAIYLHNNGLVDIFGPDHIFSGGGPNDSAVYCDGPCIYTVAEGALIEGRFGDVFHTDHKASLTISGLIKGLGNAFVDRLYNFRALTAAQVNATYDTSEFYSIGQSLVSGNSVLNSYGTAPLIPGGIVVPNGLICDATVC